MECSPEPQHAAFIGETSLTFGDVKAKAATIARALDEAGLKPGDVVAIATSRGAHFYTCFAACFFRGYPVAIIDPGAGIREFGLMLRKAAPSAVIADEELLQQLADGPGDIPSRNVFRIDRRKMHDTGSQSMEDGPGTFVTEIPSIDELGPPAAAPLEISASPALPAYIIFTSGTTSNPKAVVVSRHALRHHVATLSRVFGYDQNARLLHYLPTHHTDGLVHGVAASILTGMTVVHPGTFDASINLKQALRANEISHFLAVPAILSIIRQTHGNCGELFLYDGFRNLISTAGYLDTSFWEEFQAFYGVRVSNFYGMTETVSGSLYCGPGTETFRTGTVGKPIDAQVRIVNENGSILPTGEIGELQIAGEHLMSEYLDDPGATRAAIADGWLSTGDLFRQDNDGFFHIVGRKKNVIKRGGITVYPEDIRRVVADIPGVEEVEVIGMPDTVFEEIIVVCAVVRDGLGADEIRTLCRRELAPERRPDRVALLNKLPRGPSGKVQRDALVSVLEESGRSVESSDDSLRDRVFGLAADVFACKVTDLDEASSPDTLDNWDSYAGMEFVLALEQEFDFRLGAEDIMAIRSIGAALEVVSAATGKS